MESRLPDLPYLVLRDRGFLYPYGSRYPSFNPELLTQLRYGQTARRYDSGILGELGEADEYVV